MRNCLLFLFTFLLCQAYSQPGFFGALNRITIGAKMTPATGRSFQLNNDRTEAEIKRRPILPSYVINFSRVLSEKSEIGFEYTFCRLNSNMGNRDFRFTEIIDLSPLPSVEVERHYLQLQDVPVNLHQYSFNYNHYWLGSFAPVGKYIGVGLTLGATKLNAGTLVYTGARDAAAQENFFHSVHPVLFIDTLITTEVKYRYLMLSGTIGRNYPLNRHISLCLSMNFPIVTYYNVNGESFWPNIFDMIDDMIEGYYFPGNDYRHMVANSSRKLTRTNFEIGFSFHL